MRSWRRPESFDTHLLWLRDYIVDFFLQRLHLLRILLLDVKSFYYKKTRCLTLQNTQAEVCTCLGDLFPLLQIACAMSDTICTRPGHVLGDPLTLNEIILLLKKTSFFPRRITSTLEMNTSRLPWSWSILCYSFRGGVPLIWDHSRTLIAHSSTLETCLKPGWNGQSVLRVPPLYHKSPLLKYLHFIWLLGFSLPIIHWYHPVFWYQTSNSRSSLK